MGYLEPILVHPVRRQNFAGKLPKAHLIQQHLKLCHIRYFKISHCDIIAIRYSHSWSGPMKLIDAPPRQVAF